MREKFVFRQRRECASSPPDGASLCTELRRGWVAGGTPALLSLAAGGFGGCATPNRGAGRASLDVRRRSAPATIKLSKINTEGIRPKFSRRLQRSLGRL